MQLRCPHREGISQPSRDAGATLVELIVAISMVGILLAILLPALRSARGAAIDAKALSNVRQNVQEVFAYAAAHDGEAPRAPLKQPEASFALPISFPPLAIFEHPTRPEASILTDYFGQGGLWNVVLLLAGHPPSETWFSPTTRLGVHSLEQIRSFATLLSWYTMSAAYLAGPEHWRVDSPQDASSWRAVRLDETAYTSAKALLFNPSLLLRWVTPSMMSVVGFADGHGQRRRLVDTRPPVPLRWQDTDGIPLFTTRDGVLGRDF